MTRKNNPKNFSDQTEGLSHKQKQTVNQGNKHERSQMSGFNTSGVRGNRLQKRKTRKK